MKGPDDLEWDKADYLHEDNGCPVCGAEPGALCSYPDPGDAGAGIEVGQYVHASRLGHAPADNDTPCKACGDPGRLRRQNTAYVEDALNWQTLCDSCQEEANEYWSEMWAQYYSEIRCAISEAGLRWSHPASADNPRQP